MSQLDENPPASGISRDLLTNLHPLSAIRFWHRWCADCQDETKHRATAICDQGTLAHCTRCRKRILLQGSSP